MPGLASTVRLARPTASPMRPYRHARSRAMIPCMRRFVLTTLVGGAALVAVGPASAADCPSLTLIRKIQTAAAIRFDRAAYDASQKAAEAARLHAEGREDDAKKIAKEGLQRLEIDIRDCQPTR